MRSDKYYEADQKKEEIKKKITCTVVAAAIAITPAALVYKIEEAKIALIASSYEALLQESNQKSYLEGFFDGMFGMGNKYFSYTDSKGEGLFNSNNLVTSEVSGKKLILTKKNVNN